MTEPSEAEGKSTGEEDRTKEQHRLLYKALNETRKGLIDFEYKWATVLLVIGGWILTADGVRQKLTTSPATVWILTVFLAILTLGHALWVRGWYRRSETIHKRLCEVDYMPEKLFEPQRISKWFAWGFVLFNVLTSLAIATASWVIAQGTPLPPD